MYHEKKFSKVNGGKRVKRIGIIGAMPVEIEILKNDLEKCIVETHAESDFYIGKINGLEVVLLVCGIGKVNAAIYTQILIDKYAVDVIINTGIAGGLSDDIKHLSLVLSKQITYYDVRRSQMIGCFPHQEFFKADGDLIDLASKIAISNHLDYSIGTILTGDDFIADTMRKNELHQLYKVTCVEMEGAAIGHTAFVNQVPFIVIRCISDLANEATPDEYNEFEKLAAHKSANLVKEMIRVLKG